MQMTPDILASILRYDAETGHLYWLPRPKEMFQSEADWKSWHKNFCGKRALTSPSRGYLQGTIYGRNYRAHRVCWAIAHRRWPEHAIDHINGVRSDNRLCNLRDVPAAVNMKNRARGSNNTSGHNGVRWFKLRSKWEADIYVQGRLIHLGLFERLEDAVAAREAADRHYGFSLRHGAKAA